MVMENQGAQADHGEEIVLVEDDTLKIARSSSALDKAEAAFERFTTSTLSNMNGAAEADARKDEGVEKPTTPGQDAASPERRSDKDVVEEKKDDVLSKDAVPAGTATDAPAAIATSISTSAPTSTMATPTAGAAGTQPGTPKATPESPSKASGINNAMLQQTSSELERDYDSNPTELYIKIQKKEWESTVNRAKSMPDEARMWVSRKEKDGRLRWRLLPIHAAIIFKAPESVVEALLAAYPKGAECKDDQGMLPLHLAFRNGSTEGIVNFLLVSYPQSINVKDRKGRIPLVLAQASTSPNRAAFLKALERGPTYYASAAAATERAAVTAEQRAIFDTKLMQERQKHESQASKIQQQYEDENRSLRLQVEAMKEELVKTQETSQVLVDHVNSLEAQLASRSDTERFLATKIANLDSTLKTAKKTKAEAEASLTTENQSLVAERDALKVTLEASENRYADCKEKLDKSLDLYETREKEWDEAECKLLAQIKSLERDWASAQANCAVLEAQLKKKMSTEHALASQVSALAGKLAEAAVEARDNSKVSQKRINSMESERKMLRHSVQDLTKRLSLVASVLDQMTSQQKNIITEAKYQESRMAEAQIKHSQIVSDVIKQEKLFQQAKKERRQILSLLEMQEKQEKRSEGDRVNIMNAIALQGDHMEGSKTDRDQMVGKVEALGNDIQGMLTTVLKGIPKQIDNDEILVDEMVKVCNDTEGKRDIAASANAEENPNAEAVAAILAANPPTSSAPPRRFARSTTPKAEPAKEESKDQDEAAATVVAASEEDDDNTNNTNSKADEAKPEDKDVAVDAAIADATTDAAASDEKDETATESQVSPQPTEAESTAPTSSADAVVIEKEEEEIKSSPSGLEPEGCKSFDGMDHDAPMDDGVKDKVESFRDD